MHSRCHNYQSNYLSCSFTQWNWSSVKSCHFSWQE